MDNAQKSFDRKVNMDMSLPNKVRSGLQSTPNTGTKIADE